MWVSLPALRAIIGNDMAATLCSNLGGVPIYVPFEAHAGHELAKVVGVPAMAALCRQYRGEYITVPNGGVQKEQILGMLAQGMRKREIALACGVTERYVYMVAGIEGGADGDDRQLTLF